MVISCLLFADDTLLLSFEENSTRIHYLHCILVCFEAVLGLRINWTNLKFCH